MRLLVINPNSTQAMTESITRTAAQAIPEHEVLGWTNQAGPPAIQGPEDGAAAVAGVLALLPDARKIEADCIVIACFDDTGLAEIRAAAHCPVIGIGQAAFHMAALLGHRFSVVTTLPVSVPVIAENITAYGFDGICARVRPSHLPVLEVEEAAPPAMARLAEELSWAEAEDGISAVVLGCAGMAALAPRLSQGTRLVLIDGVAAAARLALPLAQMAGRDV